MHAKFMGDACEVHRGCMHLGGLYRGAGQAVMSGSLTLTQCRGAPVFSFGRLKKSGHPHTLLHDLAELRVLSLPLYGPSHPYAHITMP